MLRTGDMRPTGAQHVCQLFCAREIQALATRCGVRVVAASASNWASLGDLATLHTIESDPDRWRRFLDHEVAACAEPGALDGGTHLLFTVR